MNDRRYSRQELFRSIGAAGQARLRRGRVVLIGCGALGTHIAQHLVRAGVGYLRICDRDFVELDNLQRQVLFDEDDVAERLPKVVAAERKLARINSDVALDPRITDVSARNVRGLIEDVDLVIDGTDNFETRYLLNDACVERGQTWIYGGCVGSHGMVLTVRPGVGPCFACLVPDPPAPGSTGTCDTVGVIGPAVAMVAAIESTEALKILTDNETALVSGLITLDPWAGTFRTFSAPRVDDCPVCHGREFRFLREEATSQTTLLCGRNAVQITPAPPAKGASPTDIDLAALETRLSGHGETRYNGYLLRFIADGLDLSLFPDGRAVVKGTDEPERARAFYAKYVGA